MVGGETVRPVNYSLIFKALADETRLSIVKLLTVEDLCGCKILKNFDITQPTLSYHMKALCDSGIVHGRRDGALIIYSLDKTALESVQTLFFGFCATDTVHQINTNCNEICEE